MGNIKNNQHKIGSYGLCVPQEGFELMFDLITKFDHSGQTNRNSLKLTDYTLNTPLPDMCH